MSGHDSKYFSTTKKGEIPELKEELNSQYKDKRKDAVKKVIAAMTVGKDVSLLFTDVVNCMQTENLELKKLVYLYLINYAKSQPDLAILAVNTFVKDSQDPNPLIRALAVRTMGCIRVDKITEYLCDPLQRCLKDDDPYVLKTAAICVAKLYDINSELVEDRGFLDSLKDLISDNNPMVVANAVAALSEIQEHSCRPVFEITTPTLSKLLTALNECTEWGQVFILDALSRYKASDAREAENIVERVTPRLQHANCAVVLSAVKMILQQMDRITSTDIVRNLCKKMAPPLVTLLSSEPEIQYVALRNINLIIQKRPTILAHEIKVFFCKYNDPIYVKMEKLEIMIKLASDRNIDQLLLEFKEYATEVDVDFVRKAVRAIGRCAIKLDRAAERCISVLLELIKIKVNYVVQEAIIVIKDIFRRYPNTYESIIATLCESLDTLDEPEAKASMIWIIGEYAERIDNADELLESFLESFPEEPPQVQLQLLTATVKLFLKKPTEGPQQMIQIYTFFTVEFSHQPPSVFDTASPPSSASFGDQNPPILELRPVAVLRDFDFYCFEVTRNCYCSVVYFCSAIYYCSAVFLRRPGCSDVTGFFDITGGATDYPSIALILAFEHSKTKLAWRGRMSQSSGKEGEIVTLFMQNIPPRYHWINEARYGAKNQNWKLNYPSTSNATTRVEQGKNISGESPEELARRRTRLIQGDVDEEVVRKLQKCLVGTMATFCSLSQVEDRLQTGGLGEIKTKFLGGRDFLLQIDDEELYRILKEQNWSILYEVFQEVQPWSESFRASERATWIKLFGVPLHCWNHSTFKKIAQQWGECLAMAENALQELGCEEMTILIATSREELIDEVVDLEAGRDIFRIRVVEFPSIISDSLFRKREEKEGVVVVDSESSAGRSVDSSEEKNSERCSEEEDSQLCCMGNRTRGNNFFFYKKIGLVKNPLHD
ncbi:AP-2 complex subunit beta [Hibiscus syriacus]|uniref:AP-2 complex subunit beta n=1 Tax=Hibiscus syriacus TaxID=106335 RepID=A0A6A2WU80_HIBSY|nr:AP-2 complex subunit beta [Hibiscus syriacus]